MSILNIGLQSVGIMRQKTESFEEALKPCNSLKAIRSLGESNPDLKEEVLDAMSPMKALLQGIFVRLQLKDHKFKTFEASASQQEIDELWSSILNVDDKKLMNCGQVSSMLMIQSLQKPQLKFR